MKNIFLCFFCLLFYKHVFAAKESNSSSGGSSKDGIFSNPCFIVGYGQVKKSLINIKDRKQYYGIKGEKAYVSYGKLNNEAQGIINGGGFVSIHAGKFENTYSDSTDKETFETVGLGLEVISYSSSFITPIINLGVHWSALYIKKVGIKSREQEYILGFGLKGAPGIMIKTPLIGFFAKIDFIYDFYTKGKDVYNSNNKLLDLRRSEIFPNVGVALYF